MGSMVVTDDICTTQMCALRIEAVSPGRVGRPSLPLRFSHTRFTSGRLSIHSRRAQTTRMHGMGEDVVGSWFDLSKLVSADAAEHKSAFPDLAHDIGAEVYIDVNGWHLYLKDISIGSDAKLHSLVAQQLAPDLLSKGFDEFKITDFLKKVPLTIGGGKEKVSLFDSIPAYALNDLMNLCKRFVEEN